MALWKAGRHHFFCSSSRWGNETNHTHDQCVYFHVCIVLVHILDMDMLYKNHSLWKIRACLRSTHHVCWRLSLFWWNRSTFNRVSGWLYSHLFGAKDFHIRRIYNPRLNKVPPFQDWFINQPKNKVASTLECRRCSNTNLLWSLALKTTRWCPSLLAKLVFSSYCSMVS